VFVFERDIAVNPMTGVQVSVGIMRNCQLFVLQHLHVWGLLTTLTKARDGDDTNVCGVWLSAAAI
jgi:hypothetical protein